MTNLIQEAPLSIGKAQYNGIYPQSQFPSTQLSFQDSNGSSRFSFETKKTLCPCREHSNFTPLKNHFTGGKCWSCGKFFPPTIVEDDYNIRLKEDNLSKLSNTYTKPKLTYERTHKYWSPCGSNFLMKVDVYRTSEGKKSCFMFRWEGELVWGSDGQIIEIGVWKKGLSDIALTLYDAPFLILLKQCEQSYFDDNIVFIVEGEKDVETLKKLGKLATCNPLGAGKWKPEFNPLLKGLNCIVIPDNDVPGYKHAELVKKNLRGIAKSVDIQTLIESMPNLPHKGDITDYIALGGIL